MSSQNALLAQQIAANPNLQHERGRNELRYFKLLSEGVGRDTSVWGQPAPTMSHEEYYGILADALERGQSVMFGDDWRHPNQQDRIRMIYATQVPVETGFWKSAANLVASWF